jgi:hypothetical protein
VPLDDPRQVRSLADAFDLTTPEVQLRELHLIWRAVDERLLRFDRHAQGATVDDAIPTSEVERVVVNGTSRSKDSGESPGRRVGINFEGRIAGGRWIRVKVSWLGGYVVVTVHAL